MKLIDFGTAKRFDLGPLTTKVAGKDVGKMWGRFGMCNMRE